MNFDTLEPWLSAGSLVVYRAGMHFTSDLELFEGPGFDRGGGDDGLGSIRSPGDDRMVSNGPDIRLVIC